LSKYALGRTLGAVGGRDRAIHGSAITGTCTRAKCQQHRNTQIHAPPVRR
jgi:hypothetical protein